MRKQGFQKNCGKSMGEECQKDQFSNLAYHKSIKLEYLLC